MTDADFRQILREEITPRLVELRNMIADLNHNVCLIADSTLPPEHKGMLRNYKPTELSVEHFVEHFEGPKAQDKL